MVWIRILRKRYAPSDLKFCILPAACFTLSLGPGLAQDNPPHAIARTPAQTRAASTADHSKFEALKGPFSSGPEVTKACLACHTQAAAQVQKSIHWHWTFDNAQTGQTLGKKNVINAFCGNVASNEPRCTSCHAGYGWEDANYDFTRQENVDCLVCHDMTGAYRKHPELAGHPSPVTQKIGGISYPAPDWPKLAQNVGMPGRANCGACHFYGGGGDGVKHGDLDSTLIEPSRALDVHMDAQALNFTCETCHVSNAHVLAGSRYQAAAKDPTGFTHQGLTRNSASCESCHGEKPHASGLISSYYINSHTEKVSCEACHIPAMARGGKATKVFWDWSSAGKLKDGKPFVEHDEKGNETYLSIKGDFKWEENVKPHYAWFDGAMRYTLGDQKIDPSRTVAINSMTGDYENPEARIWPFKQMRGRQAYDKINNTLIYMNVFGKNETSYWSNFDWPKAIAAGMKAAGRDYSGEYGFVDSVMYWPLAHMVAPKENAVSCAECHARDGRLASLGGFYMPGRDRLVWLDGLGGLMIAGALGVAVLHAAARVMMRKR